MPDPRGLKGWLRGPAAPGEKAKKTPLKLDRHRIVVLPFSNMSPDSNDEYFADGLTEELIATISKIREVSVVSPDVGDAVSEELEADPGHCRGTSGRDDS